jgi:hypothetical protein
MKTGEHGVLCAVNGDWVHRRREGLITEPIRGMDRWKVLLILETVPPER